METYYNKYCKNYDKLEQKEKLKYENNKQKVFTSKENNVKVDDKWIDVRESIFKRDNNCCRLYQTLSIEEKNQVDSILRGNKQLSIIDPAHIFGRGSNPELKYVEENVISLFRLFHTRLDNYQHPITGKPICKEERLEWFERAVGSDNFMKLIEIKESLKI